MPTNNNSCKIYKVHWLARRGGGCVGIWYDYSGNKIHKQENQHIKFGYAFDDFSIGLNLKYKNSSQPLQTHQETQNTIAIGGNLNYTPKNQSWYIQATTAYDNQPIKIKRSPLPNTESTESSSMIISRGYQIKIGQKWKNWDWYGTLSHNDIKRQGYQETSAAFNFDFDDVRYKNTTASIGANGSYPLSNQWSILAGANLTHTFNKQTIAHRANNTHIGTITHETTPKNNHFLIRTGIGYQPILLPVRMQLTPYISSNTSNQTHWGVSMGIESTF